MLQWSIVQPRLKPKHRLWTHVEDEFVFAHSSHHWSHDQEHEGEVFQLLMRFYMWLLPMSRTRRGNISTAGEISGNSRESIIHHCYCCFKVLFNSNYSRSGCFCPILLPASCWKTLKAAVFFIAFALSTVSSEKSSFGMTVHKTLSEFYTAISSDLSSRNSKRKDMNCRPPS